MVHIIYFAVEEALRGRGLGTRILEEMGRLNPGKRLLVDIEEPSEAAPNNAQRVRRKAFYLRCGYRETAVRYPWRGVDYVILSRGGTVAEEEFERFWDALEAETAIFGTY